MGAVPKETYDKKETEVSKGREQKEQQEKVHVKAAVIRATWQPRCDESLMETKPNESLKQKRLAHKSSEQMNGARRARPRARGSEVV